MWIHAVKVISASPPLTWNHWGSIQFYFLLLSLSNNFFQFRFSDYWRANLAHIEESEDQLALSNNKPNFNLPQFPSSSPQFSYLASPSFFSFSFHHENHHHSLLNHIFIVFPSPPPPPPPFYCFPSSSMFPLPHLHISIVFPTPPPQCTF